MSKNTENLIPFNRRSPEELKALSRKGGIASGEARRKKREKIEAVKLKDKAIQEERQSNLRLVRESISILYEARREDQRKSCADVSCPYYKYRKRY